MKHTRRRYPNLRAYLDAIGDDGHTQAEFAAKMGMSQGYLSDLKHGLVRPSLALALRLSQEAGVPVESFLVDVGSQKAS